MKIKIFYLKVDILFLKSLLLPQNSKLILFEEGDRIGFHADSASQSIQDAAAAGGVYRVVLYWSVDNDLNTELAEFVVRSKQDTKLAHDVHGPHGADSIKVVVKRRHPSATSMTAEAARFGKTMSSDRIYHGTARARSSTHHRVGWRRDYHPAAVLERGEL